MTFTESGRRRRSLFVRGTRAGAAAAGAVLVAGTVAVLVSSGATRPPTPGGEAARRSAPSPASALNIGAGAYPRTTEGSVAAATTFAQSFESLDLPRAKDWAHAVAAPASTPVLVEQVSLGVAAIRAASGLPPSGPVGRTRISYRVRAYQVDGGGTDRVIVWLLATAAASSATGAPTVRSATLGFPLVWTAGGWRVTAQAPQPAPSADSAGAFAGQGLGWQVLPQAPVHVRPVALRTGEPPAAVAAWSSTSTSSLAMVRPVAATSTSPCPGGVAGLICYGLGLLAHPSTATAGPVGGAVGGLVANGVASSVAGLAAGFAQSAAAMLHQLAAVFVSSSTISLSGAGVDTLLAVTTPVAAVVATLLVIGSAASTAWRQDGTALATALLGLVRAGLVLVMLVAVVQVALRASDEVSAWIVSRCFGSDQALADRLGGALDAVDTINPVLVLLVSAVAIALVMVLWAEMLLRHVAVVLLVATAPVAAAGLVCSATATWWPKARSGLIQLIVLKPVVVVCLAVGFDEFGGAHNLEAVMAALVTLAAAVLAWPILARFMTFTTAGAGSGLAGALAGGMGGLGLSRLGAGWTGAGAQAGAGAKPGPGFAVAAERENDSALAQLRHAPVEGAAVMAGAGLAAARAGAALARGVGTGLDAMAVHGDLGGGSGSRPAQARGALGGFPGGPG